MRNAVKPAATITLLKMLQTSCFAGDSLKPDFSPLEMAASIRPTCSIPSHPRQLIGPSHVRENVRLQLRQNWKKSNDRTESHEPADDRGRDSTTQCTLSTDGPPGEPNCCIIAWRAMHSSCMEAYKSQVDVTRACCSTIARCILFQRKQRSATVTQCGNISKLALPQMAPHDRHTTDYTLPIETTMMASYGLSTGHSPHPAHIRPGHDLNREDLMAKKFGCGVSTWSSPCAVPHLVAFECFRNVAAARSVAIMICHYPPVLHKDPPTSPHVSRTCQTSATGRVPSFVLNSVRKYVIRHDGSSGMGYCRWWTTTRDCQSTRELHRSRRTSKQCTS